MIKTSASVKCITFLLLSSITGCQQFNHKNKQNTISLSESTEQISSVVAATRYLKYKCNRNDLPEDSELLKEASQIMKERGYDLSELAIQKKSEEIYQKLNNDRTPQEIKCRDFSALLSTFISKISTGSNI